MKSVQSFKYSYNREDDAIGIIDSLCAMCSAIRNFIKQACIHVGILCL